MSASKSILIPVTVAFVCFFSTILCAAGVSHGSKRGEAGEARLLFAGDILLSRGVDRQLIRNPQSLVRALRSTFAGADLVAGNLEGAVGSPDDCPPSERQGLCFPIRKDFIPLLERSGFTAIGLANNHSSDLGLAALETTRGLLIRNNLAPLTFEASPRFIRFDDVTVGLVSFSMIPGQNESAVDVPGIELRQKLRVARNLSNLVVVYVHWGSEFLDWPDKRQRQAADWLVGNGVDIIVGHHPHIAQQAECLHGRAVFYSLGNLVFDQKYPSTREGLLADCRIRGETVFCSTIETKTPDGSTLPVIGGPDRPANRTPGTPGAEKALPDCTMTLSPPLRVGGINLVPEPAPAKESSSGSSGFLLRAVQEGRTLWKTRHAKLVSIEKMINVQPVKSAAPQPKTAEPEPAASRTHQAVSKTQPKTDETQPKPSMFQSRSTGLQPNMAEPPPKAGEQQGMAGAQPRTAGLPEQQSIVVPQPKTAELPRKVSRPPPTEYLFTLERHFSTLDGEDGLRPCVYEVGSRGLVPRWRGTALAWPLVDAAFLPGKGDILCALHRGDSFVVPDSAFTAGSNPREKRVAAYRWNGFGFSGLQDDESIGSCRDYFR